MKRVLSLVLCAAILFTTVLSGNVYAADGEIVIDSVKLLQKDGTMSVSGHLTSGVGFRDVTVTVVRKGEAHEQFVMNPSALQNMAQIKTSYDGKFRYSFGIDYKSENDIEDYIVYASARKQEVSREISVVSPAAFDYIAENSVIVQTGNRNAVVYSENVKSDNPPVKTAEGLFIGADIADRINPDLAKTIINGAEYVNVSQLKNSKNVYEGNEITVISNAGLSGNPDGMRDILGFYISESGDDNNDGSFNYPVRTIEKAIEISKEYYDGRQKNIYFLDGEYHIDKTVELTDCKDMTISSYGDAKTKLNAEIKLKKEDFQKAEGEILRAVSQKAARNLVQLDLSKYLDDVKTINECVPNEINALNFDQYYRLYEDGEKQTLSRYPNAEFTKIQKAEDDYTKGYLLTDKTRAKKWNYDTDNIIIAGFLRTTYFFWEYPIKIGNGGVINVIDKTNILEQKDRSGALCTILNAPEEIDMPGEWYIDAKGKMLYYYPVGNLDDVSITCMFDEMINVGNSKNVTIQNIEIMGNNADGITINDSDSIIFDSVKLHSIGMAGIQIYGSTNSVVKNSEMFDIARSGVLIDCGEKVTLTRGNCGVENCRIYSYALESSLNSGIDIRGVENYAKNNVVYNSMSGGIRLSGNDLNVENNEVFDVSRNLYDAAAIYTSTQHERLGNKVTQNYIHNINKYYDNWPGGIYALYFDDMSNGITATKNVIADAGYGGMAGGGRDNNISNNIFIDTNFEKYDLRGTFDGWMRRNRGGTFSIEMLDDEKYDFDLWNEHYPVIWKRLLDDFNKENEYFAAKKEAEENGTECTVEPFDFGVPRNVEIKNNLVISRDKRIDLNPVSVDWDMVKYGNTYESNLGIMKQANQDMSVTDGISHSPGGAMRYEITQNENTSIKRKLGDNVKMGEIYKVSAWVYAEKISAAERVKISVDKNPQPVYGNYHYQYSVAGSEDTLLKQGEWAQVYCYWIANDNGNSIVLEFPDCKVGDVFYIDDIVMEKKLYGELDLPQPNLDDYAAGEFTYDPEKIDLSETSRLIRVGESAEIKAKFVTAVKNDKNNDGTITHDEVTYDVQTADNLTYTSDNPSVAAIENGKIAAKSSGNAIISATDGTNTKQMLISCYTDGQKGIELNSAGSYVKDKDPMLGGKAMRAYAYEPYDFEVKVKPGSAVSYCYYDTGLTWDSRTQININLGKKEMYMIIGYKTSYCGLSMLDNNYKRYQRTAGWHQVSVVIESVSDGMTTFGVYHDGTKATYSYELSDTDTIKLGVYSDASSSYAPMYVKNIYAISSDSGSVARTEQADERIVIDDFTSGETEWTTSNVEMLDKIYSGNYGAVINDYDGWFENIGSRDLRLTDSGYTAIRKYMPEFENVDFGAIGNTTPIEVQAVSPKLKYPNDETTSRTTEFVWSEAIGASEYILTVSRNADMSEPLYIKKLNTNTDTIKFDDEGTYYYTVTALNLSKQYKSEITSEIGNFTVDFKITLNSVETAQSENANSVTAKFVYDTECESVSGKAILAERDVGGKLINAKIIDIPAVENNQISVSGEYTSGNILECYLWGNMKILKPYSEKADTVSNIK